MSHLEAALEYASRGWPVFPLKPYGKKPIMAGGFHKATTNLGQIREWWERWPEANIGIPCGERTFCVVDIDPKHNGDKTYNELVSKHGPFPPTLKQQTGGDGLHLLFKPDPRVGNSESKIGRGIDTRGNDKGYICVAPSVHETGNTYKWVNEGTPLAEMPEWAIEELASRPKAEAPPPPPPPSPSSRPLDSAVEERARAYLQQCEPAIQGQGGHARLLWACTAMVHGFELDDGTAERLLLDEYNPRCRPMWNMADPKQAKEFRRKIREGRKEKQKPHGWLLQEMHQADAAMIGHAREQADALIRSAQAPSPAPMVVSAPEPESLALGATPPPELILYPPGLLGDLVSYINKTARKVQPLLALGNALAYCGALFGRKIQDEWGLRTNLFCLGVGESGCGKEHSRQVTKRLCIEAAIIERLLGGEEVTSDSAVRSRLKRHPSVLFCWDEIGHLLASMMDQRASGHRRGIVPYLMQMTGSARTILLGKEYSEEDRTDIEQPHVCIYGTTTPGKFYSGVTSAEIESGLLGRFLVFRVTDDDPPVNYEGSKLSAIPAPLIERSQYWDQFQPDPPEGTGDIRQFTGVYPTVVPTDKSANRAFQEFENDCRRKARVCRRNGEPYHPLWVRAGEHARQVGLILAGCDCMTALSARITLEHATYACALVQYVTSEFVRATSLCIADSENERWAKKIHKLVRDAGPKGMKRRDLTRQTRPLSLRMRDDIIKNLLDGEYIVQLVRNRTTYYFCPPFGLNMTTEEQA